MNVSEICFTGRGKRKVLSLYSTYEPSPKKVSLTPLKKAFRGLKGIVDSDSASDDDRKRPIADRKESINDRKSSDDEQSASEEEEISSGKENIKKSKARKIIDSDSE